MFIFYFGFIPQTLTLSSKPRCFMNQCETEAQGTGIFWFVVTQSNIRFNFRKAILRKSKENFLWKRRDDKNHFYLHRVWVKYTSKWENRSQVVNVNWFFFKPVRLTKNTRWYCLGSWMASLFYQGSWTGQVFSHGSWFHP